MDNKIIAQKQTSQERSRLSEVSTNDRHCNTQDYVFYDNRPESNYFRQMRVLVDNASIMQGKFLGGKVLQFAPGGSGKKGEGEDDDDASIPDESSKKEGYDGTPAPVAEVVSATGPTRKTELSIDELILDDPSAIDYFTPTEGEEGGYGEIVKTDSPLDDEATPFSVFAMTETDWKKVGDNLTVERTSAGVATVDLEFPSNRVANPYASPGTTSDGWPLTAHHYVSYSMLVEKVFPKLTLIQQCRVLAFAIPTSITMQMLNELGLIKPLETPGQRQEVNEVNQLCILFGTASAHSDESTDFVSVRDNYLMQIRIILADANIVGTFGGMSLWDIRKCFFGWQCGNVFSGPNTAIRKEPSDNKDAIDTDGEYFVKRDFGENPTPADLVEYRRKIHRFKETGKAIYTVFGSGETTTASPKALYDSLIDFMNITVNGAMEAFNPQEWVRITDHKQMDMMASLLSRSNMDKFAFYQVAESDFKIIYESPTDAALYKYNACYYYGSVELSKLPVYGGYVFVSIVNARGITPPGGKKVVVRTHLEQNGFEFGNKMKLGFIDAVHVVKYPSDEIIRNLPVKISFLKGQQVPSGVKLVSEKAIDKEVVLNADSLAVILKDCPICTYLPKQLCLHVLREKKKADLLDLTSQVEPEEESVLPISDE